jgi:uridine kinase
MCDRRLCENCGTIKAYDTIYFPAQKIHFERDHPQEAATMLMVNDPRLGGTLVKP